ncbi:MAG: hypothetical protein P8O16_01445 [Algoriphagus sp.]|uniref:hypothetical protein n=1 Tax=Algoriphagus sp. TaxID=1872435 RepID=UPI00263593C2|nr:hypothetical protein [Algoriphagus sp.]MDG1275913.1 hypothetical protein [Algoriphagus sp.]
MLKNRLSTIYLLLLLSGCEMFSPPKIELGIPDEIPDRFVLDFSSQAGNISWDSILVVKPYSEPNLDFLKGNQGMLSLSGTDIHILTLYTLQQKIVGYSLVPRVLDLYQLWENSESSDKDVYIFSREEAKFSFEKSGEDYLLNLDDTWKAPEVKELSMHETANYLLANITEINYSYQEVFNRSFFINVYTLNDSKATPLEYFEEYDGVLSSILISIIPDGDYYSQSKLFKIEGLENPKIVSLKEEEFPEFVITVESGPVENRQTSEYKFKGIND